VLLLFLSANYSSLPFSQKGRDCLAGLTFGLAMGNHITTILLLPVIFIPAIHRKSSQTQVKLPINQWHLDWRSLIRRITWVGIGLLVYLSLPVRALSKPPINWGNPVTLDGFAWLVSGKLYQGNLTTITISSVFDRIQSFAALSLDQFGIPGLAIGLIGLIVFFKSTHLHFSMLWIMCASLAFAVWYSSTHAIMYLIPFFICLAIWIGIGLGGLMTSIPQRLHRISPIIGLVIILALFIQAGINWGYVDASQDRRAESFGADVISFAPTDAIVFAEGDQAVFSLWYFQYALHKRTDLVIISTDLLQFEWYFQTLQSSYPDLNLPVPFPFPETVIAANSDRPVCYVEYLQSEEINCFSARNPHNP